MQPNTAMLKPATPNLRVTYPGTREVLPPEGAVVELSSYWRERIRDGSVVRVEQPPAEQRVEGTRGNWKPSQRAAPKQD